MNEQQLKAWMEQVDKRLRDLEGKQHRPKPYRPGDALLPEMADTIPAPPVTMTWQKVAGAFAKRYEAKRGLAWHYGPHVQHLEDVAEWLDRQDGDPKFIGGTLLDNWFGLEWAQKVDYKPKFLAENLGSVYAPPAVKREDEPDEDAINARRLRDRRKQEMDELAKKLARDLDEAVPPPGSLEDMMARIGKDLK